MRADLAIKSSFSKLTSHGDPMVNFRCLSFTRHCRM